MSFPAHRDLLVRFGFVAIPTTVCVVSVVIAIFTGTIGPFNRDSTVPRAAPQSASAISSPLSLFTGFCPQKQPQQHSRGCTNRPCTTCSCGSCCSGTRPARRARTRRRHRYAASRSSSLSGPPGSTRRATSLGNRYPRHLYRLTSPLVIYFFFFFFGLCRFEQHDDL